ncbi:hypothetical protein BGX24_007202, partial [Mortierella sp. AD032]
MTQHSPTSVKRLSNQQSPRLRAQGSSSNPISVSQEPTAADDGSEEENSDDDPDKTTCYTQAPSVSSSREPSSEPAPPSAHVPPSAPTMSDMPTVPEAWLAPLHQEQLAIYAQQQRELFAQIKRVEETFLAGTSAQQNSPLYEWYHDLCRREQELRYMLEARQTWDAAVQIYRQRMTDL